MLLNRAWHRLALKLILLSADLLPSTYFTDAAAPSSVHSTDAAAQSTYTTMQVRSTSRSRSPLRCTVADDLVDSDYDEEREDAQRRW